MPLPAVAAGLGKLVAWIVSRVGIVGLVLVTVIVMLSPAAAFRTIAAFFRQELSFSSGPSLLHFEPIAEIIVLRTRYSDILQAVLPRDASALAQDSTSFRIAGEWIVYGHATYSIDLRNAEILDLNRESRTATIVLPPVSIASAVDHASSKDLRMSFPSVFDARKAFYAYYIPGYIFFQSSDSPLGDATIRKAALASVNRQMQRLVHHKAQQPEFLHAAREQTSAALDAIYAPFGWDITLEWKSDSAPVADPEESTEPLLQDG